MESLNYLRRLALEARWRLPQGEAEEVIADYTELLEGDARSQRELFRDLGTPREAVCLLDEKHAYYKWLAAFAGLTLCLFLPWRWLFPWHYHQNLSIMLLAVGTAGSVCWFHCSRQTGVAEKSRLPRGLRILLALHVLVVVAVLACSGYIQVLELGWITNSFPFEVARWIGKAFRWLCFLGGSVAFLTGVFGLVWARMTDRRWCAVYISGLAAVVLCNQLLGIIGGMDLTPNPLAISIRFVIVSLMGLVMSGVALC